MFVKNEPSVSYGSPPYGETETSVPEDTGLYSFFANWKRPEGPLRVGLQVGHWKNEELPDELHKLRGTSVGTSNEDVMEWEVVLEIAKLTKAVLEEKGLLVDLLPATIPPRYWADAFVSIHADGNLDSTIRGFKVAPPWRDFSGKSRELSDMIERKYLDQVGFPQDPLITRNMRGYYAFSWWRYDHALHPMTPAVIVETGFLTNPTDATVLVNNPQVPAQALAEAIVDFMNEQYH